MDDIRELPQVIKNLRYRLFQESKDTSRWDRLAADQLGIAIYKVRQVIQGEEKPSSKELERIAEWCGRSVDDIGSAPTYPSDKDGMQKENLKFLLESLPHGGKKKAAKVLGVRPEQVSRWKTGRQPPNKGNVKDLLKYFSLGPDLDLGTVPLFLINYPIHAEAKKDWLIGRLQEMPPDKLEPHFTSIRKLITPE